MNGAALFIPGSRNVCVTGVRSVIRELPDDSKETPANQLMQFSLLT